MTRAPASHNIGALPPLNHQVGHLKTRTAIHAYRNGKRNLPIAIAPPGLEFCENCTGAGVLLTIPESNHDGTCHECGGSRFDSTGDSDG